MHLKEVFQSIYDETYRMQKWASRVEHLAVVE